MTPLIELSGIRKRYGGGDRPEVEVLHGIDLCIFSGEFVAFVGASAGAPPTQTESAPAGSTTRCGRA